MAPKQSKHMKVEQTVEKKAVAKAKKVVKLGKKETSAEVENQKAVEEVR